MICKATLYNCKYPSKSTKHLVCKTNELFTQVPKLLALDTIRDLLRHLILKGLKTGCSSSSTHQTGQAWGQ